MPDVSAEQLCCDSLMGALAVMSSKASGLLWKLGSNRTFVIQLAGLLSQFETFASFLKMQYMLIKVLTIFKMNGVGYFEPLRKFTSKVALKKDSLFLCPLGIQPNGGLLSKMLPVHPPFLFSEKRNIAGGAALQEIKALYVQIFSFVSNGPVLLVSWCNYSMALFYFISTVQIPLAYLFKQALGFYYL